MNGSEAACDMNLDSVDVKGKAGITHSWQFCSV